LREEITTAAPCAAIVSAIARPIPRDDPVTIATLPSKRNKLSIAAFSSSGPKFPAGSRPVKAGVA
jgi:hypothetical protein